jgi:hypothetical protein
VRGTEKENGERPWKGLLSRKKVMVLVKPEMKFSTEMVMN